VQEISRIAFDDRLERPWLTLQRQIDAGTALLPLLATGQLPPEQPTYLEFSAARSSFVPNEVRHAFNLHIYELRQRGAYARLPGGDLDLLDASQLDSKARREKADAAKHAALIEPARSKYCYARTAYGMALSLHRKQQRVHGVQGGAGAGVVTGAGAAGAGAAGAGAAEEEEELNCMVCMDEVNCDKAVLTPCSHLYCSPCLSSWIAEKLLGSHKLAEDPAYLARMLKPTDAAPCPTCRQRFRLGDLLTIDSKKSGGVAKEVRLIALQDFLDRAAADSARKAAKALMLPAHGAGGVGAAAAGASSSAAAAASASSAAAAAPAATQALAALAAPRVANAVPLLATGEALDKYGGKVTALIRRLKTLPVGEKAIVATVWVKLRAIAAAALKAEGIGSVVLEGGISEVSAAIRAFTTRPAGEVKVLLLALGTDCSGLTLTAANHLFVMDPVLSPGATAQLVGRIARMSQTKPCYVYHLAVAGSVEERMLVWRDALARGAVRGGKGAGAALDASAKTALRQVKKGELADANTGAADRLTGSDLLQLLDPDGQGDLVEAAEDDEDEAAGQGAGASAAAVPAGAAGGAAAPGAGAGVASAAAGSAGAGARSPADAAAAAASGPAAAAAAPRQASATAAAAPLPSRGPPAASSGAAGAAIRRSNPGRHASGGAGGAAGGSGSAAAAVSPAGAAAASDPAAASAGSAASQAARAGSHRQSLVVPAGQTADSMEVDL
jgi:hypothetical protein